MALIGVPQLFAIMAQTNEEKIGAALMVHYPGAFLTLHPGQWLLVTVGKTAKDISDDLGVTAGQTGTAVVISGSGSYFGRGNPATWEWLKAKLGMVPSA